MADSGGADLIQRARDGDARAFDMLIDPLVEPAFRLAVTMLGDRSAAEDAVQEAAFRAWRKLGLFRHGSDLRPWFLAIVANEARNRRRAAGRRARLALRAAREQRDEASEPSGLLDALNALPDDARTVLVCRYVLGLSERETAAALDVAPGTVKSRTSRALDRLRELHD